MSLVPTAEEWLVAATIATEVPPAPVHSSASATTFTAPMIIAAQQAVAEVIANRVAHPSFPKTAVGVVLQPKQFSAVMRGLSAAALGHRDIWADAVAGLWFLPHVEECLAAWRRVQETRRTNHGVALVGAALWYYSPVSMNPPTRVPDWAASKKPVACPQIASDYFRFFAEP